MVIDRKTRITISLGLLAAGALCVWNTAVRFTEIEYDLKYVKVAVEPIPEMREDIATIKAVIMENPIAKQ